LRQVLFGTFLGDFRRDAVVTRLGHNDIKRLFKLVEVELLRHHANRAFKRGRITIKVMAKDIHRTAGFVYQGRENADGGGFAGTVRPEQGKKVTFGNIQIDTTQGLETVAVGFG